jgi:CheY-like chemotaxis protein
MSAPGTVNELLATPAQVAVALAATVELGEQLLEQAHHLGQAIEAEVRRVKNSAPRSGRVPACLHAAKCGKSPSLFLDAAAGMFVPCALNRNSRRVEPARFPPDPAPAVAAPAVNPDHSPCSRPFPGKGGVPMRAGMTSAGGMPCGPAAPADDALSVLVVKDDPDTAASIGLLFGLAGHEFGVATGGPAALELAQRLRPDVAIVDIGLPGMSGYEVAEQLRRRCSGKPPFLIALTGFGAEPYRRRASEAGIDLFLVKPVDPAVLLGLLKRFKRVVK